MTGDEQKKIAIVVQRYGLEVNGGAEYHARILAEQLSSIYDVEVLTTTALNYIGWKNHYPTGETSVNGIKVIRFATIGSTPKQFRKARRAILKNKKYFRILRFLGLFKFCSNVFNISQPTQKDVDYWLQVQGPYCPQLLAYIENNRSRYTAFIFFTYLYYPTAKGMRLVPGKSIFIPTAHDEKIMFTKPYEDIFSIPAFIMYNTDAERTLVKARFENVCKNDDVAGVGIEKYQYSPEFQLSNTLKVGTPYFVYIGRVESSKGCEELIHFFERFTEKCAEVGLVIIGQNVGNIQSRNKNILFTGFITEDEKYALLDDSQGLILPSKYESLSMVTLEAMSRGKQVIVNSECEVLKQHIIKSGTGKMFNTYKSFEQSLESVLNMSIEEAKAEGVKAENYVFDHYSWETVLNKFREAINFVSRNEL